jgi:transposase
VPLVLRADRVGRDPEGEADARGDARRDPRRVPLRALPERGDAPEAAVIAVDYEMGRVTILLELVDPDSTRTQDVVLTLDQAIALRKRLDAEIRRATREQRAIDLRRST